MVNKKPVTSQKTGSKNVRNKRADVKKNDLVMSKKPGKRQKELKISEIAKKTSKNCRKMFNKKPVTSQKTGSKNVRIKRAEVKKMF